MKGPEVSDGVRNDCKGFFKTPDSHFWQFLKNHFFCQNSEKKLFSEIAAENDDIEEERRLAYVGITRAQRTLVFTLCKKRNKFGEVINCEPSRFLEEIPEEDLDWDAKRQPLTESEQKELADDNFSMLKSLFNE